MTGSVLTGRRRNGKTEKCNQYTKSHTICWDCANSTNGGCCWSREFIPVDGWEAIPDRIKINANRADYEDTWCVVKCPEFVRDAYDFGLRRKSLHPIALKKDL